MPAVSVWHKFRPSYEEKAEEKDAPTRSSAAESILGLGGRSPHGCSARQPGGFGCSRLFLPGFQNERLDLLGYLFDFRRRWGRFHGRDIRRLSGLGGGDDGPRRMEEIDRAMQNLASARERRGRVSRFSRLLFVVGWTTVALVSVFISLQLRSGTFVESRSLALLTSVAWLMTMLVHVLTSELSRNLRRSASREVVLAGARVKGALEEPE